MATLPLTIHDVETHTIVADHYFLADLRGIIRYNITDSYTVR